jgi:hypothetical protein
MAFIKQQDNFVLVGLLSLTPGQNVFVAQDGRWLGAYVASVFRGYPFRLARAEGRDDLILCIDEDSGLISNSTLKVEIISCVFDHFIYCDEHCLFMQAQAHTDPAIKNGMKWILLLNQDTHLVDDYRSLVQDFWSLFVGQKNSFPFVWK